MVEWTWLQKSRINWASKQDRNTRYFHIMASNRNSRNSLCSVMVNGSLVEEPIVVRLEVKSHFMNHFSESWATRPSLSGQFKNIGGRQAAELLEDFTEEEVRYVIKNSDGNKAPEPDGFNLAFYKKCWGVVKPEVLQFLREFHQNASLVSSLNSSFIALIPKVDSPSSMRDYRPISLIGSMYKILAKILANRIKQVMPRIISKTQSAFLGGRNILDGILIANEIVDGWRKSNKKGLVLKLDFEKAYDSVNWEFLFNMLSKFGFGDRWVRWMKSNVTSTKVSVLVNGSHTEEFCSQRGLWQGDPLSHFLFNIVAEGLNILLARAKEMGLIKGATIGNNGIIVTHLQFADDTILFCEAEWVEVVTIKRILRCFEILLGLKINYHKSVIAGIGVDEVLLRSFASRLNCAHQRLPFKYLGLPLGANPSRSSTWKPVLDKFKQKSSTWKRRLLSFAGRLTLIKSIMSNLPIYYLSLFKIPMGVAKASEKIQANFLWGGSDLRRKVHIVRWDTVTKSKHLGGLGIRSIIVMNKCLLLKWWWKFRSEIYTLWKDVLCSKYNMRGGRWVPCMERNNRNLKIWSDIIGAIISTPMLHNLYLANSVIELGNGRRALFWLDKWAGEQSFK
ncbi:unnamed protein product [Camellia sinensis]